MSFRRPTRRALLQSAAALALPSGLRAAAAAAEPMKITRIEAITFRKDLRIGGGSGGNGETEWFWLRLHTDKGITGLGETYPYSRGEIGALKDYARQILGRDPRDIDGMWRSYFHGMAMRNAGGADMRVLSALNMAQLDILGKAANLPLYRLLGGRCRSRVRVYNTTTDYWAIDNMKMGPDTVRITKFLLEHGITAMKIYPFTAPDNYLSNEAMERGLQWLHDIRATAGMKMDIAVDCWARFDYTSALRIAKALEPFNILYLEDAILSSSPEACARLAAETSTPICMSETLATRYEYQAFLEAKACDVVMFDLTWCGGPSEAKKIADMADTHFIPISPHTCGGPLLYMASIHVSTAVPNFLIMESNWWKYTHQFPHFVSNVPVPKDGHVIPTELPGLGAEIRPELFTSGDAIAETIA
jgi:L-alanine-DL-glutamate epimerase-like enolase superfamily enzyme